MVLDGNLDGLFQLGAMGKISTGYSAIDVLLCMLLPAMLRFITQVLSDLSNGKWRSPSWRLRPRRTCERRIVYEKSNSWWTLEGRDGVHNHVLQRAILLYVNGLQSVTKKFDDANLLLHEPPASDSRDSSSNDEDAVCDVAKRLQSYRVIASPPKGDWVIVQEVPEGKVEFMRLEQERDNGDGGNKVSMTTVEFKLRATSTSDPEQLIQAFVNKAYEHYKSMVRSQGKDDTRYFYSPVSGAKPASGGQEGGAARPIHQYKRYPLTEEKSFCNGFFHPEKAAIISLIDNFTNKTGKFAIPGYPHKLGLLLHGPPGTGKTSLIKALAQYTGRHIVSVPLTQVETNQELMDIMFDRQYQVVGQDFPVKLPFSKTVFVMEDVDAACSVVQKRSNKKESSGSDCSSLDCMAWSSDGIATVDTKAVSMMKSELDKDRLNLAGLLNVLDGVLDSPGRIVVMTTNHPEKLDPALIRPGRINKKLYMGYMRSAEALKMVEHYFGDIGLAERRVLKLVVDGGASDMTPATLEMLCGEQETVKDLCRALASRAGVHGDGDLESGTGTDATTHTSMTKAASSPLASLRPAAAAS